MGVNNVMIVLKSSCAVLMVVLLLTQIVILIAPIPKKKCVKQQNIKTCSENLKVFGKGFRPKTYNLNLE
jgi:hypothetical protein